VSRLDFRLFLPQMRLDFDALTQRARTAEESGFGGIALMDHLAPPLAESQPMYEAVLATTYLAAKTERLGLGHLVLCDAMRHPAMLAKEAVTLDHASSGRFELGLGWGSVPSEFETFGVGDPTPRVRVRRMAETLEVLKALWSGESVDYDGEFHRLVAAQQMPTPLSSIPIVIGGVGPKTLELVARHADWWNVPIHQLDRLDELRGSVGEARVSVQVMVALIPDEASRAQVTETVTRRFGVYERGLHIGTTAEIAAQFDVLASRGIERIYVWFADFAQQETLEQFGAEVINPT
jgi:alkanesulfonate monooxygenase SsuD/methylene tetrahydromethanopterin reductase-like flavin-dependent oxidoreductase (luciferase family)